MARLACLLVLVAVASCAASESRIVGGTPAGIEQFPGLAQIQYQWFPRVWSQTCAGNILTSRWILTAASCTRGTYWTTRFRRVIVGSTYRNTGGYIRGVDFVRNHPLWEEGIGNEGDLALIHLSAPLVFSAVVQQSAIVRPGEVIPDSFPVLQAGWGLNLREFPDVRSTRLYEVTLLTINNAQCAQNYANFIIPRRVTANMICAGRPEGGAGACIGDNGAPLYVNNVVVGIASFGWGCRNATFPRVHTAISPYTNWIVDNAI